MDADILCAASVVGFVVLLSFVARGVGHPGGHGNTSGESVPHKGRALLAQSNEWLRLSEQDSVPLFSYRHAAFALAYLNAARLVAHDQDLQKHGLDVHLVHTKLESRLTMLSNKISKTCAPSNPGNAKGTTVSWV